MSCSARAANLYADHWRVFCREVSGSGHAGLVFSGNFVGILFALLLGRTLSGRTGAVCHGAAKLSASVYEKCWPSDLG